MDTEDKFVLEVDQVLKAIGQTLENVEAKLELKEWKIRVDNWQNKHQGSLAGGDCAYGGDDLTVTAVAEGRDAAENINKALGSQLVIGESYGKSA